jgi:hypothetical protein
MEISPASSHLHVGNDHECAKQFNPRLAQNADHLLALDRIRDLCIDIPLGHRVRSRYPRESIAMACLRILFVVCAHCRPKAASLCLFPAIGLLSSPVREAC